MSAARPTARRPELIDGETLYAPLDAAKLAKETSTDQVRRHRRGFVAAGLWTRAADQMVRGTVNLPHGTGKTAR